MRDSASVFAPGWLGGLPRRDLIILPMLVLGTLLTLCLLSEVGARLYAPALDDMVCIAGSRSLGLTHGRANCTDTVKIPEGPVVTYSYNACGYRSEAPCGDKPAGGRRIAVMGGSFAMGYAVPYQDSFGARVEQRLRSLCGGRVEQQNLGSLGTNLVGVYRKLGEALALKPDLILVAVLPFDIQDYIPSDQVRDRDQPEPKPIDTPEPTLVRRLSDFTRSSRALAVARHVMLSDRKLYMRAYAMSGDSGDFLRQPLSAAWERRLADFDTLLGAMAAKTRAAGVPLAVLLGPHLAQVILMTSESVPPGHDPWLLGRRLGEIAARHGVEMIDSTLDFARIAAPERLIYTVNGHPDGKGYAVIAESVVRHLTEDGQSPFAACQAARPSGR